jgi:hypothetical protein
MAMTQDWSGEEKEIDPGRIVKQKDQMADPEVPIFSLN